MSIQATGIILAGGRSRRFGSDKATAEIAGRTLSQHVAGRLSEVCSELVIVRALDQHDVPVNVDVLVRQAQDSAMDHGPLEGIVSGLLMTTTELAFVVATDAPLIVPALAAGMLGLAKDEGCDVLCPDVAGYPQPLVAVYRPATCIPAFQRALENGDRKILVAYEGLRVKLLDESDARAWDADLRSFRNANTKEALAALEALISGD